MNQNIYKIFLGLYIIFILTISAIPNDSIPKVGFNNMDKLFHFIVYYILGLLAIRSFKINNKFILVIVLVNCIIFGAFDEWWQSFISNRHTSIADFVFDSIGIILAGKIHYKPIKIYD